MHGIIERLLDHAIGLSGKKMHIVPVLFRFKFMIDVIVINEVSSRIALLFSVVCINSSHQWLYVCTCCDESK